MTPSPDRVLFHCNQPSEGEGRGSGFRAPERKRRRQQACGGDWSRELLPQGLCDLGQNAKPLWTSQRQVSESANCFPKFKNLGDSGWLVYSFLKKFIKEAAPAIERPRAPREPGLRHLHVAIYSSQSAPAPTQAHWASRPSAQLPPGPRRQGSAGERSRGPGSLSGRRQPAR